MIYEAARLELRDDPSQGLDIIITNVYDAEVGNPYLIAWKIVALCKYQPDLEAEYLIRFGRAKSAAAMVGRYEEGWANAILTGTEPVPHEGPREYWLYLALTA